ncbi:MAG: discoidin domain-containing protein [bacterium]
MKRNIFPILFLWIITITSVVAQPRTAIDLSGKWGFEIDRKDVGVQERWFARSLKESIMLPGSMTENGKGDEVSVNTEWTGSIIDKSWFTEKEYEKYRQPGNIKIPFWLQPVKYYVGPAWYQKEIVIPDNWVNKQILLSLERCHWETQLWVDEQQVGMRNSLSTPNRFDLTKILQPGKHTMSLRIDNRVKDIYVGRDAHSVTDHTQSNWNGIIGKIELQSLPEITLEDLQLFPDIALKQVKVRCTMVNSGENPVQGAITMRAKNLSPSIKQRVQPLTESLTVPPGQHAVEYFLSMGSDAALWDEFHPNMYKLQIDLLDKDKKVLDTRITTFGMREFKTQRTRFTINGNEIFLRGTLECAIFPKTGYPSMEEQEWKRIFAVCKAYGLNHMRFHSWCPPDAAFRAADKLGIYLSVEICGWTNVGDGKPYDNWLYEESERIVKEYGNHPSFCMMAYGNEPNGKNMERFLGDFVLYWKKNDTRRVYTSASGWPLINENDYHSTPTPRIQGWGEELRSVINAQPPQTMFDYREFISKQDKPVVSHEIGQWCVYPNFNETKKYSGVLKPKNFEIFKETLEKNHLGHLANRFLLASGKLQALCYKHDIEAALRTPGMAGFQLLDLHDFPGQGTALVGVLDPFWEEKGYVTAAEYSRFCNSTVPLTRMKKTSWTNDEKFVADVEAAHFGDGPLHGVKPRWVVKNADGRIIRSGEFKQTTISIGNAQPLGSVRLPLEEFNSATKLMLAVCLERMNKTKVLQRFDNSWDFWVYPATLPEVDSENILVAQKLDQSAIEHLNRGGNLLLTLKKGSLKPEKGGAVKVGFSSIFWNTAWTSKQAPHTLGILCDPKHAALKEFPTEHYSNWQWWDAMAHAQAIALKDFSPDFTPIVRVIDDWFTNRSLGLIVEMKVGKGKVLMTGIDLLRDLDNRVEARQLLYSLKKYMASSHFQPKEQVQLSLLQSFFRDPNPLEDARIIEFDSEVKTLEAINVIDDDVRTFWHTPWEGNVPDYPHTLVIDLGREMVIQGFLCTPRQDGHNGGWIEEAVFSLSNDGKNWGGSVVRASFDKTRAVKKVILEKPLAARFIRFVATRGIDGQRYASLAELKVIPVNK